MKKLSTALFLLFLSFLTGAAQTASRIDWEKDFKKALAAARQTGKPVLLVFTSPDCKQCREMDEKFWLTEQVSPAVREFITVRVNFEAEKPLAAKLNVTEAPFVAITDPLGNIISFRRGFDEQTLRRLNTMLKDVIKDFSKLEKSYQAIERDKDDGAALLEIADFYRNAGIIYLSSEFYKKAIKTSEIGKDAGKKERIALALGVNAVSYRDYKQAVDYLESYLKSYPQGAYRETAITLLSVSSANLLELKDADKYLAQLKTEFPDSKNVPVALKAIETARSKGKN